LNHFQIGNLQCPANTTALIIQVDDIQTRQGQGLTGPGITKRTRLTTKGMPDDFWEQWQAQSKEPPFGVDIFLPARTPLSLYRGQRKYANNSNRS
jgi:alpha-D-ribose 1-methylphosphonate 5-triphosphate synthase subunit PhnH